MVHQPESVTLHRGTLSLLGFVLLPVLAFAQPAYLVEDLEPTAREGNSFAFVYTYFEGAVYFVAHNEGTGRELWVSDGTAPGTRLVADLCPGACDSRVEFLGKVGDRLIFRATDGASGMELWSLRRGEKPQRVRDLCTGSCDGVGREGALLDGALYFAARVRESGWEVWRTDGTAGGTERVAEICAGRCDADPTGFVALEDNVYFAATAEVVGRELWRTDGTAQGTVLVKDLCPGCDGDPQVLTNAQGRIAFVADDGVHGREPWISDGTVLGTRLLADLQPGLEGSNPWALEVLLDRLYVRVRSSAESCIWRESGNGLMPAAEVLVDAPVSCPREITEWKGEIYFTNAAASQLWATSGTPATRRLVSEFFLLSRLTATADALLFSASTPVPDTGPLTLWFSDGSTAGTRSLGETQPGITDPWVITDTPLGTFLLMEDGTKGREPWVTAGTPESTRLLADVAPVTSSFLPDLLTVVGDRLLFTTDAPFRSSWLYSTDGREGSVELILDRFFIEPIPFGNQALILSGIGSEEVWRTDGTVGGTTLLRQLDGSLDRRLGALAVQGSGGEESALIYGDFERGQKLWRLDLDTGEEVEFADLHEEWSNEPCIFSPCVEPPKLPASLTAAGEGVFFLGSEAGSDPGAGTEVQLWWTAGTTETTRRLHTFDTGQTLSGRIFEPHGEHLFPRGFLPFGGGVLFNAFELETGFEPWMSDGTVAGTRPLGDLWAGAESSEARALTAFDDGVCFFARGPEGDALWFTDGSPEGTRRVTSLTWQGEPLSGIRMTAVGDYLFFTAFSEGTGEELWVSDGTAEGTRLVTDLLPGPEGSAPRDLTAVETAGRWLLLFAAGDPLHGREAWATDGTAVRLVQDLAPGPASSNPGDFQVVGSRVLFSADDGIHDRELWALPLAALRRLLPSASALGPVRRPVVVP